MQTITLTDYLDTVEEFKCPQCGAEIPETLQGCWNCSFILNRRLVKLYEDNKREGR